VAVARLKAWLWNLPGRSEKNHDKNHSQLSIYRPILESESFSTHNRHATRYSAYKLASEKKKKCLFLSCETKK
jgi:hypothetical protein